MDDHNLMKFLEEDEDETMHSGADVEAFTAELNRDIEGDASATQKPSDPDKDDANNFPVSNTMATQTSQEHPIHIQEQDSKSNVERESHIGKLQNLSSRPMMSMEQKDSAPKSNKQVAIGMLLPIIEPQLDKDRAIQLHNLFFKLKKNDISKDDFIRLMKNIVGDQMLRMAVYKLQTQGARNPQATSSQFQSHPQASLRQMQASSNTNNLSNSTSDGNTREEIQADFHVSDRKHPTFPAQGLNKQQHMHLPKTSFPTYGGGAGSGYTNFPASQMRQAPAHQNMTVNHSGPIPGPANTLNKPNFDRSHMTHVKQEHADQSIEQRQNTSHGLSTVSRASIKHGSGNVSGSMKDESFEMQPSRMGFIPSVGVGPTNTISSPMETTILSNPPRSITSPMGPGNNSKAPLKKPSVGQKKPMEAPPPGSSPPSSKKQKVSGASSMDQSIDQLNDVTAVSGVNLREEEEQLFSGPKEDSRVSEASRRVVQEEEDRLILNKIPLQKKVVEIMTKRGLKNMSNDVERCLSLCVEERMRGVISNVIRLSKHRVDSEKPRHQTTITSDVRQQIMAINRKAKEELEKKQAETEKYQKPNDPESSCGIDGDMEKDESRAKPTKANKEEDDKMRTTAANVAVRAATGVGDMMSKWQLMAEANKQKNGGGSDTPNKDLARKSCNKIVRENRGAEKREPSSGAFMTTSGSVREVGRNQVLVDRSLSGKDVIAVLGSDSRMSKSTLMYRLCNKVNAEVDAE